MNLSAERFILKKNERGGFRRGKGDAAGSLSFGPLAGLPDAQKQASGSETQQPLQTHFVLPIKGAASRLSKVGVRRCRWAHPPERTLRRSAPPDKAPGRRFPTGRGSQRQRVNDIPYRNAHSPSSRVYLGCRTQDSVL